MSTGERNAHDATPPALWDRLAELLSGPEGFETARLLQRAGLIPPAPEPPAPAAPATPAPASLGAPPPPGHRRVCLVGESAAAGYLYSPWLTPAKVLARQLAACRDVAGAGLWEVVDLARNALQLEPLLQLASEALRSRPDAVVVFAGNNWLGLGPVPHEHADRDLDRFQEYADAVERRGPGGLRDLADEAMRRRARTVVDRLAALAASVRVPLIVVVPAANLLDFETLQPVFWLPGDGVARWHALYRQAVEHLQAGDGAAAEAAAREMTALDGGDCATAHRLLATALLLQERDAEAHAPLAAHLDAACWDARFGRGSAAPSPIRDELIDGCRRHGLACIDLPTALTGLTGSLLAGRSLFLDHCHHTAEGIRLAMAAVAVEILRVAGATAAPDARQLSTVPGPDLPPAVDALARLDAALYNAHTSRPVAGGPAWIPELLLEEALDAAWGVRETMRGYMAAMTAPGRAFLTAACGRTQQSPYPLNPLAWLPSDLGMDVLDPMARMFARRGDPAAEELDRLLVEHHSVDTGPRDVAHPRYREREPGAPHTYALRQQPPTIFRALWPTSTFFLVTAGGRDLLLDVTLRCPGPGGREHEGEPVEVSVNGAPAGTIQATGRWSRTALRVEARKLRRGLNRVSLSWPLPRHAGDLALHIAVQRLRQGLPADLYPVFGEVFSLVAGPDGSSAR